MKNKLYSEKIYYNFWPFCYLKPGVVGFFFNLEIITFFRINTASAKWANFYCNLQKILNKKTNAFSKTKTEIVFFGYFHHVFKEIEASVECNHYYINCESVQDM